MVIGPRIGTDDATEIGTASAESVAVTVAGSDPVTPTRGSCPGVARRAQADALDASNAASAIGATRIHGIWPTYVDAKSRQAGDA